MAQDISISISDAFESAAAVKTSQARSPLPDDTAAAAFRIAPEPARPSAICEDKPFSPLYTATQPRTAHETSARAPRQHLWIAAGQRARSDGYL